MESASEAAFAEPDHWSIEPCIDNQTAKGVVGFPSGFLPRPALRGWKSKLAPYTTCKVCPLPTALECLLSSQSDGIASKWHLVHASSWVHFKNISDIVNDTVKKNHFLCPSAKDQSVPGFLRVSSSLYF